MRQDRTGTEARASPVVTVLRLWAGERLDDAYRESRLSVNAFVSAIARREGQGWLQKGDCQARVMVKALESLNWLLLRRIVAEKKLLLSLRVMISTAQLHISIAVEADQECL